MFIRLATNSFDIENDIKAFYFYSVYIGLRLCVCFYLTIDFAFKRIKSSQEAFCSRLLCIFSFVT